MEEQQASFWFVIGLLLLFTVLDDLLMKLNNEIKGRHPEDPQGSVGCGFYIVVIAVFYIIALIVGLS